MLIKSNYDYYQAGVMAYKSAESVEDKGNNKPVENDTKKGGDSAEFSKISKSLAKMDELSKGIEDIYKKNMSEDEIKEVESIYEKLDGKDSAKLSDKEYKALEKKLDSIFERAESKMSKEEKASLEKIDSKIGDVYQNIAPTFEKDMASAYSDMGRTAQKPKVVS
jgi:ElaB/YqjD/DUF883 family membrane-anchored ribosome-binding protein